MAYKDLREFIAVLEKKGLLTRVKVCKSLGKMGHK